LSVLKTVSCLLLRNRPPLIQLASHTDSTHLFR